jgi:hypothetical protein
LAEFFCHRTGGAFGFFIHRLLMQGHRIMYSCGNALLFQLFYYVVSVFCLYGILGPDRASVGMDKGRDYFFICAQVF